MDNLTVELLCMLLQNLESLWVGLVGNDNRAVRPHDAGLGFSNGFNAATCAWQQRLVELRHHDMSEGGPTNTGNEMIVVMTSQQLRTQAL